MDLPPLHEADWFVALAHARMQSNDSAKAGTERADSIGGKHEHAYQAGVPRLRL